MTTKTILWNVDTQKDFMNPDGSLYVEGAEDIKEVLKDITNDAKEYGFKVINTCDWHFSDSEELSDNPDFINTFPPHCMAYTDGAKYIDETNPEDASYVNWNTNKKPNLNKILKSRNIVIRKDKFDVFEGNPYTNEIVDRLKEMGYEEVIVYGVASNVCVDKAVMGLLERNMRVSVFANAIKGLPNIESPENKWKKMGVNFIYRSKGFEK